MRTLRTAVIREPASTRRQFLAGTGTFALAALLGGCGDGETDGRAAQTDGSWEFTDDRGRKISLPRRPQRIVAQVGAAAALWDFGIRPVGIFGEQKLSFAEGGSANTGVDHRVGNLDLGAVEWVGTTYGEFNIEKYAALQGSFS